MRCPTHPARPFQSIVVNKFITPYDEKIVEKANELLRNSDRTRDGVVVTCFNFVSTYVKYVPDKWQHGYPEWWLLPKETLENGIGDCEDSSYLLDSLIVSAFNLSSLGTGKQSRVAIGVVSTESGMGGHAWVESQYSTMDNWYILESTSDSEFEIGRNVVTIEEGYEKGYMPEWYVYEDGCEQVSRKPLYKHYPLLRPGLKNKPHNLGTRLRTRVIGCKKVGKKKRRSLEAIWTR